MCVWFVFYWLPLTQYCRKTATNLHIAQFDCPRQACRQSLKLCVPVQVLVEVARSLGIKCHVRGTMLAVEGPRFSSRAESLMFRQWGADVINMTTVPEVVLAKEAGLCYASIAMATDYDCWKEHEEAVSDLSFLSLKKKSCIFRKPGNKLSHCLEFPS